MIEIVVTSHLTARAWVSGPDLAPQKFLLSQQFRYLMRCKKYLKKFFLSCLVSEIQLFVYIFWWNSKRPPEVQKNHKAFLYPLYLHFYELWRAENFFGNRKLQKTWLVTPFGPLAAILKFTQKCKQTAVSQKLSKIKKFFQDIFCISWGA